MKKLLWLIPIVVVMYFLYQMTPDTLGQWDKEFDRTGEPIEITTHVYKNKTEVTNALREWLGDSKDVKRVHGWATWSPGRPYTCDVHVTEPKGTQDKESMETWGHELSHCNYGAFHESGHYKTHNGRHYRIIK